jgi:hypothetical protein
VNFQPWCQLLSSAHQPAGFEGGWKVKVINIVKISLMERGHYDGAITIHSSVFNTIRQNQAMNQPDVDPKALPSAAPREPEPAIPETPAMSVEDPQIGPDDEDMDDADTSDAGSAIGAVRNVTSRHRTTPKPGITTRHIKDLRDAFPLDVWPRAQECDADPLKYYPGKVYLGKYSVAFASKDPSKDPSLSLWARVTKKHALGERHGHVKCTDDDGKTVNFRGGNLAQKTGLTKYLALDVPFQLIDDGKDDDKAMKSWRASVYVCVRVALVDKGFIRGAELTMGLAPTSIAAVIKKNVEKANGNPLQSERSTTLGSAISNENAWGTPRTSPEEADRDAASDAAPVNDQIPPDTPTDGAFHVPVADMGSLQSGHRRHARTESSVVSNPADIVRQSPDPESDDEPVSRQRTSRVPAKRGFNSLQGAQDGLNTDSTGPTSVPNKRHIGERKRKSNVSLSV